MKIAHNPIKIVNSADGKTVEINIEGTIGGEWSWFGESNPDEVTKENIRNELKAIGAIKGDIIIVNINSPGGDVNHGLSIHDLLAANPAKIEVRINGMTASAATIIAMAGDKIKMSDNALFLPHMASTGVWGNANEIKATLSDLEKVDGRLINIYAKRTGKTHEEVAAQMAINNGVGEWMTADEAVAFGFVDTKFEPKKMAAKFDNTMLAKMGLPVVPEKLINKEEMKDKTTLVAEIIAGIKNILNPKTDDLITAEAINSAAETQYNKIKTDFDAAIAVAVDAVKVEMEAASADKVKLIQADLDKAKADLLASETELARVKGVETPAAGKSEADPTGSGKQKLTANERAALKNAQALFGGDPDDEEDEENSEEAPESKKKK